MMAPIVKILIWIGLATIFVGVIVGFFPTIPFPNQIEYALEYFFEILWSFDFILPVSSIFNMLYIALVMEIAFFSVRLFLWFIDLYSGKG